MRTVLVVDDEANICTLIKNLIDWNGMELTYIGEAYDGVAAVEMIRQHEPDIVITDIKMPRMDGLGLLRTIHSEYKDTVSFIMISGFKEFNYAYEAIKYGVVDFLLKPINQYELNSAIRRLIATTTDDIGYSTMIGDGERDQIVRKQLLIDILYGDIHIENMDLSVINTDYRYHFKNDRFMVVSLCFDGYNSLGRIKNSVMSQLVSDFASTCAESCHDIGYYASGSMAWVLFNPRVTYKGMVATLRQAHDKLKSQTRSYSFLETTLGLSSQGGIKQLKTYFIEAQKANRARIVIGKGKIIEFTHFDEKAALAEKENNDGLTGDIKLAVELLNTKRLLALCERYIDSIMPLTIKAPWLVISWAEEKCKCIVWECINLHAKAQLTEYFDEKLFDFGLCKDSREIKEKMKENVSDICDKIKEYGQSRDSRIIRNVKEYIASNYKNQITLDDVAKQVFLSASYLGVLFKKETGALFSQYLTGYRMERAKVLLRDYSYSVKEIAGCVGYKDIRNFSKLFRTHTGVKPTDYRKLYRLDTVN